MLGRYLKPMIRYEYVDTTIKAQDIHPDIIFTKEQELAQSFVENLLQSQQLVTNIQDNELLFKKWNVPYVISPQTWSVKANLKLSHDILQDYFYHSELAKFRASKEYQQTMSENRHDLWENQINWIETRISRYLGNSQYHISDCGSKAVGWLELLAKASFTKNLSTIDPLPPIVTTELSDEPVDIICLIDTLQRQLDAKTFLTQTAQQLKSDGLLIITCRGLGFDVLTLREHSDSIFPLDHLFLPSPLAMQKLLEETGFEVLEITTPGLMDAAYVNKSKEQIPPDQYFQRYLMAQQDPFLLERLQGFLQRNNLSSHLRCVAKKK